MIAATSIDPSAVRHLTADEWSVMAPHRLRAVGAAPYLASLLLAMPVYAVDGITASVDRSGRLYVGMGFIRSLTDEQAVGVLLHEVRHVLAAHADRADAHGVTAGDRARWNRAADLTINDELFDGGFALPGDPPTCASHGLARGLAAETYFDVLVDSGADIDDGAEGGEGADGEAADPHRRPSCGSGAGGAPAPWELPAPDERHGNAPTTDDDARNEIGVEAGRDETGGDETGSDEATQHTTDPPGDSAAADQSGDLGRGLTQLDLDLARRQVADDVARHVAHHGTSSVPAELRAWAEDQLQPPSVSWRDVLRTAVRRPLQRAAGVDDYTWARPNRRRRSGNVILPATVGSVPTVAVVVDTSGSISSKATRAFVAELVGLVTHVEVAARDVIVVPCDDRAHAELTAAEVIAGAPLAGGRGTDMGAGLVALGRRRGRIDIAVVFTDGHTPWPADAPPFPVVVVIARHGSARSLPDWATVVTIDD